MVTGAASGLGRAIAVALGRQGWRIALADVDVDGLQATAELVKQVGGDPRIERLDVRQPDQWLDLITRLRTDWPDLDLLVNNAGVAGAGEVGDFALDNWRWVLDINLFGAIQGCHFCRDWLVANPRGAHIVNVASVAALISAPGMGAYNVSKAGLVALSETLYAELRPRGVGVTVVCPGFFATNLLAAGRFDTERQLAVAKRFTQRAHISADDVATATLRAVGRGQLYVVLPLRARVFWRLRRLFPAGLMKFIAWAAQRRITPDGAEA